MFKTDEFIAKRLRWKAGKYDFTKEYTIYIEDISANVGEYLNQYIKFEVSGIPVIFFMSPSKDWTLICTRQIIFSINNNVLILDINAIKQITFIPSTPMSENHKNDMDTLFITDHNGIKYSLPAYRGIDVIAMHNIILMDRKLNRS